MAINMQKLAELAQPRDERAAQRAQERKANREWLTYSQDIALALHYYLRKNQMSQKELAEQMGVSSVYVGKLLKGGENLTLETICKLQHVIGEQIIQIIKPYETGEYIMRAIPYVASEHYQSSEVYSERLSSRQCHRPLRLGLSA